MVILFVIGINYGKDAIRKAELEDIKTDMLSIKSRAKIIVDEYNYEDIDDLKGVEIEDQELLSKLEIEEGYIWDRETLDEEGLNAIDANKYAVSYNLDDPNDTEVYYIDGYDGAYSLTAIQEK